MIFPASRWFDSILTCQQPVRVVFENLIFFNISRPSAEGHLRTMPMDGSCFIEAVFQDCHNNDVFSYAGLWGSTPFVRTKVYSYYFSFLYHLVFVQVCEDMGTLFFISLHFSLYCLTCLRLRRYGHFPLHTLFHKIFSAYAANTFFR